MPLDEIPNFAITGHQCQSGCLQRNFLFPVNSHLFSCKLMPLRDTNARADVCNAISSFL